MILAPNPTLDKLCRFLASVRGTDKVLMLIQYVSKILIWHFQRRGLDLSAITRLQNLAGPVSDTRVLLRYSGLVPLVQWTLQSETIMAAAPKNAVSPAQRLLTRLQNLANFIYYPLEHTYWLALHQVIPMGPATRDRVALWSCRAWAAYVVLYFAQLHLDARDLRAREKALMSRELVPSSKGDAKAVDDASPHVVADVIAEVAKLEAERRQLYLNVLTNAAYFPLTLHWSLERSSFPDVAVGVCGTVAAVTQFYTAWQSA
ncbi:hypothetical protein HKX48_009520 [Thoreauomyces humboldtii]|nr:hypothetical protein HKX48_009520 [Thoreauomyces humboldtii]